MIIFCLTLIDCVDSYSMFVPTRVTAVARNRPRSFCQKCRWQVAPGPAYTFDPTKSEWADYAVQVQCGNLSEKRAHKELVRKHSSTVVSAR